MNKIKLYFKLLLVSHYIRIITAVAFIAIGGVFGYNGLLEVKPMSMFFDVVMWIGVGVLAIYALILIACGIYFGTGHGYQTGDYNKWRDGDFDEWKEKNNIGNSWFEKFIDGFDRPSKKGIK